MTPQGAIDAMSKVFLDAWVAAGYLAEDVRWDDVKSPPLANRTWARVTIRHTSGGQHSFGKQRTYTNGGIIWIQVFTPVGAGKVPTYAAAHSIVSAFRDAKNLDVWFRNERLDEVGASGAFEQINVQADFTYDELR